MSVDTLREKVDELYKFRDEYFSNFGSSDPAEKNQNLKDKLDRTLELIDSLKERISAEHRGEILFLRGRALNVLSDYSELAEHNLGKATKFNFPAAWNELGECQFKKGDLLSAKSCFEKALAQEKNKVYFRNMSMLMRSLAWNSIEERHENLRKGLQLAKEALKLDVTDGHSWLILGNAYLAQFFSVDSRMESLRNCKAAYAKAENDSKAVLLPELYFSKFQIQWYEEDYVDALKSLLRAYELEQSWKECITKYDQSRAFLSKLTYMQKTCGQLNQRRLNSFMNKINLSCLGPYNTKDSKFTLVSVNELKDGNNEDKVILGKVLCTVVPESGIPFSFCIITKDSTCVVVSVYNWADNYGVKIGDSVGILAPVFKRHSIPALQDKEEEISFTSVRVALPLMLVVNKKKIGTNQVATSQVVSTHKLE